MKQKTPLQELIEWLKKEHELIQRLGGENERLLIEECIKNAESMLEKEKEVMYDAWLVAISNFRNDTFFEEYYNETFNTKEK